jgi:Caenorhabditis elegans ly-6-related protein
MSAVYEDLFREENGHLSRFFYEPRNFTNACDEGAPSHGEHGGTDWEDMGVVPCRAICLTLTQDFVVMGRKTGRRLTMRGCATTFSRYGFYNRTIAMFDQYDMCREVLANELFRYDTDSQPVQVGRGGEVGSWCLLVCMYSGVFVPGGPV